MKATAPHVWRSRNEYNETCSRTDLGWSYFVSRLSGERRDVGSSSFGWDDRESIHSHPDGPRTEMSEKPRKRSPQHIVAFRLMRSLTAEEREELKQLVRRLDMEFLQWIE